MAEGGAAVAVGIRPGPPPPPLRRTPVSPCRPVPPKVMVSPMPSPILRNGNRGLNNVHRDTALRSARGQKDDRPSSGSSSGSGECSAASTEGGSAGSSSSGGGSTGNGSMTRVKRVQIVTDSPYDELPPYRIDRNSMYRVSFPGKTWDIMMQGFRIALEYDNVFMCDHFLGRDNAERVLTELRHLKHTGQFERHMRRGPGHPSLNYACLFLMDQEESHRHLDAVVLMVYKLACYYCDDWAKVSVELSYFPEGHREQVTRAASSSTTASTPSSPNRRLLKCVYFPNNDWNLPPLLLPEEAAEGDGAAPVAEAPGMLTIQNHNRKPPHQVEPVFDRLVVFWGDALDHVTAECPDERYGVTIWLHR